MIPLRQVIIRIYSPITPRYVQSMRHSYNIHPFWDYPFLFVIIYFYPNESITIWHKQICTSVFSTSPLPLQISPPSPLPINSILTFSSFLLSILDLPPVSTKVKLVRKLLNYINNLRVGSNEIRYKAKVFVIILYYILKRLRYWL